MKFLEIYGEDDWGVVTFRDHYKDDLIPLWERAIKEKVVLTVEDAAITVIGHSFSVSEEDYDLMKYSVWGDDDLLLGYDILPVGDWEEQRSDETATDNDRSEGHQKNGIKRRYLKISGLDGGVALLSNYSASALQELWEKAVRFESETESDMSVDGMEIRIKRKKYTISACHMSVSLDAFQKFKSVWSYGEVSDYLDLVLVDC